MKTLIVYYSLDGNTAFVAKAMVQAIGADVLELKLKDEIKRSGFMKYFCGGKQVFTKQKPALSPFEKNPSDYDCLFIGTPVWAFSFAPALATFFDQIHLKGKRIALFCCSGGGKGKTLEKMKAQLAGNEIIGEIDFIEPLKRDKEINAEKARAWAREYF